MPTTNELSFAGTTIEIDEVAIGIVTSYETNIDAEEAEVTGASDTLGTAPQHISQRRFVPTGIGETAQIEGITVVDDAGQLALEAAARSGTRNVVLKHVAQDGNGLEQTGFITNFRKGGQVNQMWTFSASFRVNAVETIEPGS